MVYVRWMIYYLGGTQPHNPSMAEAEKVKMWFKYEDSEAGESILPWHTFQGLSFTVFQQVILPHHRKKEPRGLAETKSVSKVFRYISGIVTCI